MAARSFDRPRGTRDLYPEDYLQRRYITETWRRVALRHGFDEIDGPTFEHLDLYTVKSGEGIVSELFSFSRAGGDETYALRPEYTPTLARQYAARAGQLPRPTRWFSIGPYFRAERPQRGRLREFLQWNVDVLGDETPLADAELLACLVGMAVEVGLDSKTCRIFLNSRTALEDVFRRFELPEDKFEAGFRLADAYPKMSDEDFRSQSIALGIASDRVDHWMGLYRMRDTVMNAEAVQALGLTQLVPLISLLEIQSGTARWCECLPSLARGLAYYTGTVFEMIAEGERAVAGGGRYDNLIELLGGPPTPAVGFAMGDVVLANLLEDKGLMPTGKDLRTILSQSVQTRPDVFAVTEPDEVIPENATPEQKQEIEKKNQQKELSLIRTCAVLRRGTARDGNCEPWDPERYEVPPLHVRRSYKATRNTGKLIKQAHQEGSRFFVIIGSDGTARVEDLDSGEQWSDKVALGDLATRLTAAR